MRNPEWTEEVEVTILNGLKVTLELTMLPAEPDVGIASDYISDWQITELAGRLINDPQWLYDRIMGRAGEEDRMIQAAYNVLRERK